MRNIWGTGRGTMVEGERFAPVSLLASATLLVIQTRG